MRMDVRIGIAGSAHFLHGASVTVTKTELHRASGKVFRRVARGETVTVTEHGEGIAVIRPLPGRRRPPTDAEIDAAIARVPVVRDVTWEQIRAETREE